MELNYFEADATLPPGHENQLTRALLTLFKLSPAIHAAFIDLLRERQVAKSAGGVIPPFFLLGPNKPIIQAQVGSLPLETGSVLSALVTDEHFEHSRETGHSDRRPVFDGVIAYPPDWQVVVENKPRSESVWEGQLSFPKPDGVEINPVPIDLRWSDVISRITALDTSGLLCHTESVLVSDFVDFVARHFQFLNPYTDFLICKRQPSLMTKRCHAILGELGAGQVIARRGTGGPRVLDLGTGAARFVSLWFDQDKQEICVGMWPADTLNQAREFRKTARRKEFYTLQENSWRIDHNLHFSHIQKHRVWVRGIMTLEQYWGYWYGKEERLNQVRREGFPGLFDSLQREGAITASEREVLESSFTTLGTLNPCPGFAVIYAWPVSDAEHLDNRGQFVPVLRGKVVEAMGTWGQELGEQPA